MWNEHCSYKSSKKWLRTLADHGSARDPGPGRERRRHRYRRRRVRGLQDGEPQPPLLHRALPGRGDRRRRHPARRLHHGRAADRRDERAPLRRPRTIPRPGIWWPASSPASAATAIPSACRRSAARSNFHARYNGNCLVNAFAARDRQQRRDLLFQGRGRRPAGRLSRRQDRPRRRRRRDHGLGRIRRPHRGEAPDRAGRRPLHRKAPARSLPRADGSRAPSSPSRTWARPASPARPSRWAPRATSASSSTSTSVPMREAAHDAPTR